MFNNRLYTTHNYNEFKDFDLEEHQKYITELYERAPEYDVDAFNNINTINSIYKKANIKMRRINAPSTRSKGIFINNDNSDIIIKVLGSPYKSQFRHTFRFIKETYWMVHLYKVGLSPEFISLGFIKLKDGDKLMIHCIIKLKKHKTFNEYYREKYTSNSNSQIKNNIMEDDEMKTMFEKLLNKFNEQMYSVMDADFHLNNFVMSLDETEILAIDCIPLINGPENTFDAISFEFS